MKPIGWVDPPRRRGETIIGWSMRRGPDGVRKNSTHPTRYALAKYDSNFGNTGLDSGADIDRGYLVGIAREPHRVARQRREATQPPQAGFGNQVVCRHRREMHVPDARGAVERRRDDACAVGAEGGGMHPALVSAQDRDFL